jgi:hypothetical protein
MELKNMKHEKNGKVEVYYELIQKLVHGLQVLTTDSFLITMFRTSLQLDLKIATMGMKQSILQQHKEVVMLCEEGMTTTKAKNALLVSQNKKQIAPQKTQSNTRTIDKFCTNCGMTNHNVETCKMKE